MAVSQAPKTSIQRLIEVSRENPLRELWEYVKTSLNMRHNETVRGSHIFIYDSQLCLPFSHTVGDY